MPQEMKVNSQYTDIIYCCLFQVPVKTVPMVLKVRTVYITTGQKPKNQVQYVYTTLSLAC